MEGKMVGVLLVLITLVNGLYAFKFAADFLKHKKDAWAEPGNNVFLALWGAITFFLATFGISDFALSTILYRARKLTSDSKLPGTLNTQCAIPVAIMALAYISTIRVDTVTLISCIVAQMLGAYICPRFAVKFPAETIRTFMGVGFVLTSVLILAGKFNIIPLGGDATGLSGVKLGIAWVLHIVFGALNNVGVGSCAPTMATIYALGVNPAAVFPIMMGACTFSVPMGAMEFIRLGQYGRKITLFSSIFGVAGVLAAVSIVKSLNLAVLQWIAAGVVLYSGASMLYEEFFKRKNYCESRV